MNRAGEIFGIETLALHSIRQLLPLLRHHLNQSKTLASFEGRAQGIGESFLDSLPCHQAIHHHLDVVALVLVQFDVVGQLPHFTIDAHPGEALSRKSTDQLAVGAFLTPHHRCKQLVAGRFRQQQNLIDHLVDALRPNRAFATWAVRLTSTPVQQTQIILNLRDGANR